MRWRAAAEAGIGPPVRNAPETATARAAGLIVNFVDRFQTKGWAGVQRVESGTVPALAACAPCA